MNVVVRQGARKAVRGKEWALRIVLVFLSTGLGLGALELVVRWQYADLVGLSIKHLARDQRNLPDPELISVRKPFLHWEGRAFRDEFAHHVTYRTDENGFRNAPGIKSAQVVFIGDSFVEAGNVPEQDTFVCKVGAALGVATVNLGRSQYGPQQELILMRRYAFDYGPRTIVWVLFEGNDLKNADKYYNGTLEEVELAFCELDRPEARGTIWFDKYELYELGDPPKGDEWRQGSTSLFNDDAFLRLHVKGDNLLRNGSFEQGTNGLACWLGNEVPQNAGILQDGETPPIDGNFSFKITLPGNTPLWLRQHVTVKPGTQYLLKGCIKVEDLGGGAHLAVASPGSGKGKFFRRGMRVSGTQDWTELGLVFSAPEQPTRLDVYLHRRPAKSPVEPLKDWLHLVRFVRTVYEFYRYSPTLYWGMRGRFALASGEQVDVGFQYKYNPDAIKDYPDGWMETKRCLEEGLALCQGKGVRLLVVYIPIKLRVEGPFATLTPASDEELEAWLPEGKWEQEGDFASRIVAYCRNIGCEFIDARPRLMARAKAGHRVYSARFDSHLDVEGHAVITGLVTQWLRRK